MNFNTVPQCLNARPHTNKKPGSTSNFPANCYAVSFKSNSPSIALLSLPAQPLRFLFLGSCRSPPLICSLDPGATTKRASSKVRGFGHRSTWTWRLGSARRASPAPPRRCLNAAKRSRNSRIAPTNPPASRPIDQVDEHAKQTNKDKPSKSKQNQPDQPSALTTEPTKKIDRRLPTGDGRCRSQRPPSHSPRQPPARDVVLCDQDRLDSLSCHAACGQGRWVSGQPLQG